MKSQKELIYKLINLTEDFLESFSLDSYSPEENQEKIDVLIGKREVLLDMIMALGPVLESEVESMQEIKSQGFQLEKTVRLVKTQTAEQILKNRYERKTL